MRIASLLPSATEIVYALGLGDALVAVTHECDHPSGTATKPAVTRNLLPSDLSSGEIDRAVTSGVEEAHSVYELDVDRLVSLRPDVILTQDVCRVCAVPRSAVDHAAARIEPTPRVVSLDPASLDDVLDAMLRVGEATGTTGRARDAIAALRGRLDAVRDAVARATGRPRVFCCEWFEPVFRAGHWVPEQVRIAGGEDTLSQDGEPSMPVAWEEVLAYEPEVIVLMPCGFGAAEAAARARELARLPGWESLPAVRSTQVYAVDASAYFSRPGPRLVDGVELLARILHPEAWDLPAPEGAALKLARQPLTFAPYR